MTSTGALTAYSGTKTGRSPSDKRVVKEPSSEKEVWWGPVNKEMTPEVSQTFRLPREPVIPSEHVERIHNLPRPKRAILPYPAGYPSRKVVISKRPSPQTHATKMCISSHGDDAVSATAEGLCGRTFLSAVSQMWIDSGCCGTSAADCFRA